MAAATGWKGLGLPLLPVPEALCCVRLLFPFTPSCVLVFLSCLGQSLLSRAVASISETVPFFYLFREPLRSRFVGLLVARRLTGPDIYRDCAVTVDSSRALAPILIGGEDLIGLILLVYGLLGSWSRCCCPRCGLTSSVFVSWFSPVFAPLVS